MTPSPTTSAAGDERARPGRRPALSRDRRPRRRDPRRPRQNAAADWHLYAAADPYADRQALSRLDTADTHLTALADRLADLPRISDRLDSVDLARLADRIRHAAARLRRPDGQPGPPPDVIDAAQTIRDVAATLAAETGPPPGNWQPAPAGPPPATPVPIIGSGLSSLRVRIAVDRWTLNPPCACAPLVIARHIGDLPLVLHITCHACRARWHVAFLGDPDVELWACWADQPETGQPDQSARP
ncbi:MAG: hypothetical protein ACRD0K_21705 [Egibacteraceae bacterium]